MTAAHPTAPFALNAARQKQLNILVLGAGVMGSVHLKALERYGQWLQANHGIVLQLGVVDKDPAKLAKVSEKVSKFTTLDAALEDFAPGQPMHGMVAAFNDDQHASAFRKIFARRSEVNFILSEKPITETLAQTRELESEFNKRYVSLNTIIHFSPVFDVYNDWRHGLHDAQVLGYTAVWGKDRTKDTRPTIGVRSESIHALGVIAEMLEGDQLQVKAARLKTGYLSPGSEDVPFDAQLVLQGRREDRKALFHCSYELPDQNRRVTQFLRDQRGLVAAEFNFDAVKQPDQPGKLDQLRIYRLEPFVGVTALEQDLVPSRVATSLPDGVLPNDKVGAWIGRSMNDVLDKVYGIRPAAPIGNLTYLAEATALQETIESINPRQRLGMLVLAGMRADPAKTQAAFPSLNEARPAQISELLRHFSQRPTASAPAFT